MLVAMHLYQHVAGDPAFARQLLLAVEELREEGRAPRQARRSLVALQQAGKLIAQRADACRLQADDRRAGLQMLLQDVEISMEQTPGRIQAAPIVQRPPAAHMSARDLDLIAEALEQLHRGDGRGSAEVVVERVRPQQDLLAT